MTADLYTAVGIYAGFLVTVGAVIYYLWMWGE